MSRPTASAIAAQNARNRQARGQERCPLCDMPILYPKLGASQCEYGKDCQYPGKRPPTTAPNKVQISGHEPYKLAYPSGRLEARFKNPMPSSDIKFMIIMPIATVSEANGRDHWAKKAARAKKQREQASYLCLHMKSLPLPLTVNLVRVSPRLLDDDNLRSALKAVRDGIADRLGINDRDPRVVWQYGQRKGKPQAVEVTAS